MRRGAPVGAIEIGRLALAGVVASVLVPSTALGATWAEIPSKTTEDITAVEYQGPDRFWFATGNGKIFRSVGGAFLQVVNNPGREFRDIEFQDGGDVGFAVGTGGAVLRSSDAGASWTPVNGIGGGQMTTENQCNLPPEPLGDVDSIAFAGNSRAWIVAGGSQIFRTGPATPATVGASAAAWQYINGNAAPCRVPKDVDDLFAVAGTSDVYFVAKEFGTVYYTSNALDSPAAVKPAEAGNGSTGIRRLAGDPGNPNRQWSVINSRAGSTCARPRMAGAWPRTSSSAALSAPSPPPTTSITRVAPCSRSARPGCSPTRPTGGPSSPIARPGRSRPRSGSR